MTRVACVGHVEWADFAVVDHLPGPGEIVHATEWFTLASPMRIKYRFQIEDPGVWDKPWGSEYEFFPLNGQIYEYACHEGN